MKHRAIVLVSLALTAACGVFSQDDVKPRREMEDPSYEPSRSAVRKAKSTQDKEPAKPKSEVYSPPASPNPPAVQVEVQVPSGPRVKYILDGKPYYDGDLPVVGPVKNDSSASSRTIEPPVARPPESVPVANTGPAGALVETDLTADKPGTVAAAQNQSLLETMEATGHLNSRAKKCYALLVELKANVETIARCLDHRGKENATLMHASEVVSKNISDMAEIWPGNEEFRDRCTSTKRNALIFNDELSQSPWRWAQVRWSFDALLKDVRGFRDYCKGLADIEKPPRAIVDKNGNVTYIDEPDPFLATAAGQRAEKLRLDQEEITKRHKFEEAVGEKKDVIKTDLDGHEAPQPGRSRR